MAKRHLFACHKPFSQTVLKSSSDQIKDDVFRRNEKYHVAQLRHGGAKRVRAKNFGFILTLPTRRRRRPNPEKTCIGTGDSRIPKRN